MLYILIGSGILVVVGLFIVGIPKSKKEKHGTNIIKEYRHNLFFNLATKIAKFHGEHDFMSVKNLLIHTFKTYNNPEITYCIEDDLHNEISKRTIQIRVINDIVFEACSITEKMYLGSFNVTKFVDGPWTRYLRIMADTKSKSFNNNNSKVKNLQQASMAR